MSESQKRFEEWMLSLNYSEIVLSKYGNNDEGYRVGSYVSSLTAIAWLAWQEAEKQLQATNQQLVEALERTYKLINQFSDSDFSVNQEPFLAQELILNQVRVAAAITNAKQPKP